MKPKVVITNRVHDDVIKLLDPHCDLILNQTQEPWNCLQLLENTRHAVGMMAFMTDCIDAEFIARCPRLRIIASVLKGYDNFDVNACTRHGIWLAIVQDGLTAATAELTIGLMIDIGRRITPGDARVRENYQGWRPNYYGSGIANRTVGILGMGAIGKAVATRLKGFDCRIRYFDERPIDVHEAAALGARYVGFDDLLAQTDFLIIALPLNKRTKHLISERALDQMKTGSYLINPARGSIVDEEAVVRALARGRLGGYAADVFEMEDLAREDRPISIARGLITDHERTILTPHLGSAETYARRAAEMEMAQSILDVLQNHSPRCAVNLPVQEPALAC